LREVRIRKEIRRESNRNTDRKMKELTGIQISRGRKRNSGEKRKEHEYKWRDKVYGIKVRRGRNMNTWQEEGTKYRRRDKSHEFSWAEEVTGKRIRRARKRINTDERKKQKYR
jgi:hypothetical protein